MTDNADRIDRQRYFALWNEYCDLKERYEQLVGADYRRVITIKEIDGQRVVFHESGTRLGEIDYLEDGYLYFWPTKDRAGAWSEHVLRAIADTLYELNKEWDRKVRDDIGKFRAD